MAHVLAVSGSPSRVSRTAAVINHAGALLERHGHSVDRLHLRVLPGDALLTADLTNRFIAGAARRLADADVVVLGTPVYNAAYSGLLKAWLDSVGQRAMSGKTVLPVIVGGSQNDLADVEQGLRPVLHALGAAVVASACTVLRPLVTSGGSDQWRVATPVHVALEQAIGGLPPAAAVCAAAEL